jgi:hypothetical protein
MRTLSLKGVLLGGIADIVATNVAAFPLMIVAAAQANVAGLPKAEQSKALLAAIQASFGLQVTGWILGGLCSVLGGYVAARLARRGEVVNGALSAYLCVGLGIVSWVTGSASLPAWQHVVAFVVSPALGAVGGYLRLKQVKSADNRSIPTPVPA